MNLCDQCARLLLAPIRNDVPMHLHSSDPSAGKIAAALKARVFDCVNCHARWGWKDVVGWFLKAKKNPATDTADDSMSNA